MKWRTGIFLLPLLLPLMGNGAAEDNVPVLIAPLPPLDTPVGSWLAPYNLDAFFATYETGPVADIVTELGTVSVQLYPGSVLEVANFVDLATQGTYRNTIIHGVESGEPTVVDGGAVRLISGTEGSWDLQLVEGDALWFLALTGEGTLYLPYGGQNLSGNPNTDAGKVVAGHEVLEALTAVGTFDAPHTRLQNFTGVPLQGFNGALAPENLLMVEDIVISPPLEVGLQFELLENQDPESLHAGIADGWLNLKGLKASDGVKLRFRVTAIGGMSRDFTLVVPVEDPAWAGYFDDSSYWGQGWTYAGSLSWLYVDIFPWVYHAEHGWLYAAGDGGRTYTFYDQALGWVFVTPWEDVSENPLNQYPFVYRYESDEWLWFASAPGNGERWFWSYGSAENDGVAGWIRAFEGELEFTPHVEDEVEE